jgi:ATP-binding cassette, subfamily C, bacterial LapB
MTPVGPGSAEIISPGVAARIGVIRALVRQPLVLSLDQVESYLDLDGIERLVALLKELKGHTTVFLVWRTPMTIQLADRQLRVPTPPAPNLPRLVGAPLPVTT